MDFRSLGVCRVSLGFGSFGCLLICVFVNLVMKPLTWKRVRLYLGEGKISFSSSCNALVNFLDFGLLVVRRWTQDFNVGWAEISFFVACERRY